MGANLENQTEPGPALVYLTVEQAKLAKAAPDLLRLLNSMCGFAYAIINPAGLTEDYHEAMRLIAKIEE